jgi:taurine dioxygenase
VTEHHADRILELAADRSRELLDRMFDHLYGEEHVYTHRWQLHDLIFWDNLAVQHARPEAARVSDGKRAMQRVVLNDVAFPELVERARRQQEQRRLDA